MSRFGRAIAASVGVVLGVLAAMPTPAVAEDSDRVRFYLGMRGQDTNPATEVSDAWGFSLGVNLGRHLGAELAGDFYELGAEVPGRGKIGEYGVLALGGQLRLRYPLLQDRLVPYLVGGVGVAFTQFNDRKPRGFGLSVQDESSTPFASIGGGIEYFVADNVAIGIETKYLVSREQRLRVDEVSYPIDVDAVLTTLAVRLLYPELRPAPRVETLDTVPSRLYFGVRVGGAASLRTHIFPELESRPEPPAYFSTLNQFYGLAGGVNYGRHLGVELVVEGYEIDLHMPGRGSIGEYAVYAILPQLRLRVPLRDGLVVPYLMGGVGLGYTEFNDRKAPGRDLVVTDRDTFGLAASVGGGIEYFVTSNIAVHLELRYLASRGHTLRIDGRKQRGSLDALVPSVGLRVYLADF